MDVAASPFQPAAPPRTDRLLPIWRMFVGEMSRNALIGWPKFAFERACWYRRVVTLRVHLISDPDAIGRIFLENVANYPRPPIVKRMLAGLAGESLLTSGGRRLARPAPADGAGLHAQGRRRPDPGLRRGGANRPRPLDARPDRHGGRGDPRHGGCHQPDPVLRRTIASPRTGPGHMQAALAAVTEYRLGVLLGALGWTAPPSPRRGEVEAPVHPRAPGRFRPPPAGLIHRPRRTS